MFGRKKKGEEIELTEDKNNYKCERRKEYICCRLLNSKEKTDKEQIEKKKKEKKKKEDKDNTQAAQQAADSEKIIKDYKNIVKIKDNFLEYIKKNLDEQDKQKSVIEFLTLIDIQNIIKMKDWYNNRILEAKNITGGFQYYKGFKDHADTLFQYFIDKDINKIEEERKNYDNAKKRYNEEVSGSDTDKLEKFEFLLPICKIDDSNNYIFYNMVTQQFSKKNIKIIDTDKNNSEKIIDNFLDKYLKDDDKKTLKKQFIKTLKELKDSETKSGTIGGGKRKKSRKKKSRKSRKAKRVKKSRKAKSKSNKKTRKKHH